jgi:ATP-dependent RNA helicase DDX51/DBP6
MLAEAGVPELVRCEISSELLQPLVPRYEEALSQLERTVKVRTTKLRVRVLQIKPQEL